MNLFFSDLSFISYIFFIVFMITFFFLTQTVNTTLTQSTQYEDIKISNSFKNIQIDSFLHTVKIYTLLLLLASCTYRCNPISIMWGSLSITNGYLTLTNYFLTTLVIFLSILSANVKQRVEFTTLDFFYSFSALIPIYSLIIASSNLLVFIFILEVYSCFLFYKFISSNIYSVGVKSTLKDASNTKSNNSFISTLFMYYWSVFFSTTLLLFSLIVCLYLVGSSDWLLINAYINNILQTSSPYKFICIFFFFLFFFGFVFKAALAPSYLFKVEIYKGLPFTILFYYTTIYFLLFTLYFLSIFSYNLPSICSYTYPILLLFISVSLLLLSLNLFNAETVKSLLAFSSALNFFIFFLLTVSLTGLF